MLPGDVLLRAVPVPLLIGDHDGRCTFANPAARELLLLPEERVVGRSLIDHAEDRDRLTAAYRAALDQPRVGLDVPIRRGDGTVAPARWDLAALRDERGRPWGVVAVVRDVGAEHRSTLETEQARLAGILAALPAAVYTVDGSGRITGANPAAAHLAGVEGSALLGQPCRAVLPLRDEAGRALCDWACPRARGEAGPVAGDLRAFLPDGPSGSRIVLWSCALLRGPIGAPLGWIEVVRDVSQLHQLELMRETILSAVSHELLTPVAIIKGHAETLRDPITRADPSVAEAALVAIDEEAERLRRLVANVLDAARANSGVFTVERAPLALQPIVVRTVQRFRGRSRRHTFTTELPDLLPLVLGDRERLESVLYNLLDNAVKYSPRGGQIVVRATVHTAEVEVVVEDEGVGIRWADTARIFEPYYRAEPGAHPRVEGSGLGLFICRTIVEAHGGRIWVTSMPGQGTAFHFTVPRAEPAQLPVPVPAGKAG